MKKTYNQPTCLVVELGMKRNFMLTGSVQSGERILDDGGQGDGTDIGTKGITDINIWDDKW